ncbi:cyclopropane-fatty-acyl-phospholipid synthase family protein [Bacteriovoracaceae bacterium]|nr:cyclopropane-fatty-acyl-phospholipid synthase family protein [Bacteriovoracaceae bacterium]
MIDSMLGKGVIPDFFIRGGIKSLLKQRLKDEYGIKSNAETRRKELIHELKHSPIAVETDKANDQHYMVPPEFFKLALGDRLKYSCCHWDKAKNLDEAEVEMLELTVRRAQINDGDKILELGHGWGAITLFMAEKFPNSEITAVSNSADQGEFIRQRARERNLNNIKIITADVTGFSIEEKFDRIISIEMFEHMRNYQKLLGRINSWLNDEGTLFVHIFAHRELTYKYEVVDESDWMSKYFFSGGIMPSEHLFYYFQDDLNIKEHWRVNGNHYAKTARAWLENMDTNRDKILRIFDQHYPNGESKKWFNYWRIFFMSCEELWAYNQGEEWIVSHYLFEKR